MEDTPGGFNVGKALIEVMKVMKKKGVLSEQEVLDILWESKDPLFPWTKQDIKDLINL